jgi:hypothetical protein
MIHLIKKQELRLKIGSGVEAFRVQHAASSYYQDRLLPLLERVFDEVSEEQVVIRIDRLEIDFGRITEKEFREDGLSDRLYALIRKELLRVIGEHVAEAGVTSRLGSSPGAGLESRSRSGLGSGSEAGSGNALVQSRSTQMNALMQWWYYMEKGRLPWNATGITREWQRHVLETLAVDHGSITRLRNVLMGSTVFLQRVSFQHSDEFLEILAGILASVRLTSLAEWVEELCRLVVWIEERSRGIVQREKDKRGKDEQGEDAPGPSAPGDPLRRWKERHAAFLRMSPTLRKAAIWRIVLREVAARAVSLEEIMLVLRKWLMDDVVFRQVVFEEGKEFGQWADGGIGRAKDEDRSAVMSEGMATREADGGVAEEKAGGDVPDDAVNVVAGTDPGDDGIFVSNAGLILLHPFLTTLLSRCGWWDGHTFVNTEARQQAVFLLHFLATGEKEAQEHALVFPKLLCGYGLEMPLPGSVELSDEACEEGTELLKYVLRSWDKLKSTSIAGLQESFLQRPGKLISRQGRLVLLMEISAIDVLLDYLPWNIGIVKLPWIKDLLYTEWR